MAAAGDAYEIARARHGAGTVDFLSVLDAQRVHRQARRDLVSSEGRLKARYVTVNKALGNVDSAGPGYTCGQR